MDIFIQDSKIRQTTQLPKICDLEGGVAAMLTSSGQAANFYAIMNIAEAGDHIVVRLQQFTAVHITYMLTH